MMTAFGRSARTIFTVAGKRFRSSLWPLCLPPSDQGWQGTPPAISSRSALIPEKSNSVTSVGSTAGHSDAGQTLCVRFRSIVATASSSHSITASCMKPAFDEPRARPPAPAKSSIDLITSELASPLFVQELNQPHADSIHVLQLTLPNDVEVPARLPERALALEIPGTIGAQLRQPEIEA